ncbi:MAG: DUF3472 domain-containing protein [Prevotella sp.]|nr:DUF3472 domain-containing protein [Prevotella sp.]
MKNLTMKMAVLLSMLLWRPQAYATEWTISVTPNGTYGGYIETTDGLSQHDVAYSTTWPIEGYLPVFYVHFPVGTFTVTSNNANAVRVNVRDVSTGTDVATNKSARNFTFTSSEEGWYRLQLTGGTPGTTVLQDFTVTSTNATGTNSNVFLAGWRSAPSLHLFTFGSSDPSLPSGNAFDWIYDEVMIPTDADYYGTYAEAFGFNSRYIGIQNNGSNGGTTKRTIIFSSWDNGDTDSDPELADFKRSGIIATGEADEITAERFGGEGTGCHIMMNGGLWKPGQWVRFLLNTRPEQITLSDGTTYNNTLLSAWYWAEGVDTEWHYIGTIRQSGTTNYFGSGFNAFLEEYTRGNTSQGCAQHKAYYRRIFTRSMQTGTWYNRNLFDWSHTDGGTSDGARNDWYQSAIDDFQGEPAIYMQSGGYTDKYEGNSNLPLIQPDNIVPDDETLQSLITTYIEPAIQKQDEDRMALAIQDVYTQLDQTEWTVIDKSSEETVGEGDNGRASMAVDNDNSTYWHTSWWSSGNQSYPHSLSLLHDGAVTIDMIRVNIPSGRSSIYRPKTVEVMTSANGSSWTSVGSYDLPDASEQDIVLGSSLTTKYLKLNFTAGYGQYLVISELEFFQKDEATMLANLRAIAQDYLDRADLFNSYSTEDLAALQAVYDNNASTITDYQTALSDLAKNGQLLKYGEVTEVAHLSAEKAYYVFNASGYGAMVANGGIPTLRNANPVSGSGHYYDCQNTYKAKARVQDEANNWMILTTDKFPGYYYLYNIGEGKYLNPQYNSNFSETPQPFSITLKNGYFVLTALNYNYNGQTQVCVAPQFDSSPISVWNNDAGNYFVIYDNYSITPSAELIDELRTEVYKDSRQQAGTVAVINISDGMETYANTSALDFSNVEGLRAYRASEYNQQTNALLLQQTSKTAAGEGLLLKGENGEYEVPYINSADAGTNMFVGVTQASSIPSTSGSNTNFTLSNGTNGRTFYPFAGGTIPANKAYLRIPTDKVADNPEDGMALFFDRGTKGDVNDDGKIDVTDVVLMVNVILNNRSAFFNPWAADANDDDEVNINDVVIIVNLILNN